MKSIINFWIVIFILLFCSCADWLNVNPQTEIKESELFKDEAGFKSALTGVYIMMADENLYGMNMSFYLPELLAQHWYYTSSTGDILYRLSTYDFKTEESDESLIADIWICYYKAIAQLNNILDFLDRSDAVFEYGNDKIIKGEALGLRAFLHFELFRLFAPHPSGNNLQEKTIPYMTSMTRNINELTSIEASKVIEYVEQDLNSAEVLLAEADPILKYTNNQLNSFTGSTRPKDDWQMCRQSRFNYYAILATKARFYHWIGNKEKAMDYAQKVIDSGKFSLTDNTSYSTGGSLVFLEENIFNVVNPDHQDIVKGLFIETHHRLKQTSDNVNVAFETSMNPDDIRARIDRYWTDSPDDGYLSFLKYCESSKETIKAANKIPLIRLSEMYLILMELKPLDEAVSYFYDYRVSRLMNSVLDNNFEDEDTRMLRIEKEYRKEFFGEGQMFYFYKRLNYPAFSWPSDFVLSSTELYTIPKPDAQLNYEFD